MVIRKRLPITGKAMAFVTTTVTEWTPVFADERCALSILRQLHRTITYHQLSLAAYVLMPSHIHLLMGFREIEKLSKVVQQFKSLSARQLQPLLQPYSVEVLQQNGRFHFWKPRFDEVIIWSEKQFMIKADYIHNNPVKAGLANKTTDYPFSSAGNWFLDRPGLVPVDKDWLWLDEGDD